MPLSSLEVIDVDYTLQIWATLLLAVVSLRFGDQELVTAEYTEARAEHAERDPRKAKISRYLTFV